MFNGISVRYHRKTYDSTYEVGVAELFQKELVRHQLRWYRRNNTLVLYKDKSFFIVFYSF